MNGSGVSWASEVVWNDGVDAKGNHFNHSASSGGISSYYSIPSWQTNVSHMAGRGGSASFRNIPDVAACADNIYEIYDNGKNTNDYDDSGGTSAAAPLWAGFMALVNQQLAVNGEPSAGFINPALYTLAARTNYAAYFHDVTSGSNTWVESPDLFYATNGYDLCTGLGTMNGTNLINALAAPIPAPSFLPPVSRAGKVTLTWSTVPGITYQVQYISDLRKTNWINFGSAITGSGSVTNVSDAFTNAQRFYRLLRLQ